MSSKINLDLKNFRHLKSDKSSTTLQHKTDGHQIVLAHKSLSPEAQTQLSALAGISKDAATPSQSDQMKHKMAKGGQVCMDDGGRVPAPPTAGDDKKETMRQVSKGVEDSGGFPSLDTMVDRVKNAYSDGGKVEDTRPQTVQDIERPKKKDKPEGGTLNYPELKKEYREKAKTFPPQSRKKFAEGTPDEPIQADAPAEAPVTAPEAPDKDLLSKREAYNRIVSGPQTGAPMGMNQNPMSDRSFGPNGQAPAHFDPNAWTQAENESAQDQKAVAQDATAKAEAVTKENEARGRAGLPLLPNVAMQSKDMDASSPAEAPKPDQGLAQPQTAAPQPSAQNHDPESMLGAGFNSQMQGIQQEATAKGALGQAQSQTLDNQIKQQQQIQDTFKQHYAQLENERQAHMADIKAGYIDPMKYWDNHSKIASGIGMILAGFNPSTKPNAAIDFINHQMEMNLKSQETNLGAKQNLLAANLRQFGNLRDAADMTRIMQNDVVVNQLQSAAMKATSPMAKAAAMQAAGQLQMQAAPQFQQFALRRSLMSMNGRDAGSQEKMLSYLTAMNPEMAKPYKDAFVPGIGMSSSLQPIPQGVREQLIAKQQFGQAVDGLRKWSAQHSGSVDPRVMAEGKAMAANVQNLYRQGINGGVFKQGEQSFINGIIDSDPAKFFSNIRVLPKLNEAARENAQSMNVLKKGYGLPIQQEKQSSQTPQAAMAWAKANPKDPRAQKILKHLGQ